MNCKFCGFVLGKIHNHTAGYPFLTLHETPKSLSFLSSDLPKGKDSHIIVIPKKHYPFLEDIPKSTQHDLIQHVSLAVKVIRKTHGGCNVLLNNGKSAGQYVPHAHFHIVPRDKDDHIKIEVWKRAKVSSKRFLKLHNHLKERFESFKPK